MAKPLLYLSSSQVVVTVKCRDCEYWAALRFDKLEAWRAAAAHEQRSHPESYAARDALKHAEKKAELSAL